MKHVINTGTDVASLAFFDAAALPDDIDQRLARDITATQVALVKECRLAWINSESDGGYVMHFYVDEPVPERLSAPADVSEESLRLHVPSGVVWACGMEYLAKDPALGRPGCDGLRKRSHMGASFQIPTGDYAAEFWAMEWPEEAEEEALARRLGAAAVRKRDRLSIAMGWLIGAAFILGLTLLVSWFRALDGLDPFPSWHAWGWPGLGALALAIFATSRLLRPLERVAEQIAREFPSFVVHLQRL